MKSSNSPKLPFRRYSAATATQGCNPSHSLKSLGLPPRIFSGTVIMILRIEFSSITMRREFYNAPIAFKALLTLEIMCNLLGV